jgi:hypothetical protein
MEGYTGKSTSCSCMPMQETDTEMILNTGISTLQSKEKPIKRKRMKALFNKGDLVQIDLRGRTPLQREKVQLDTLHFKVLKVFPESYMPTREEDDGCMYILDMGDLPVFPILYWTSRELKKAEVKPISNKDLDELNNLLDECLNNNRNENQLQREDNSVSSRISEGPSRVHGRRHQARVSISHPKHQKGVRG